MRLCYNCAWEWRKPHEPAFREMCPRCDAFLHSCRNCALYEPTAHHQCKSPTTEQVADKDRGNFCEEFRFKQSEAASSSKSPKPFERRTQKGTKQGMDPREKWRRLFKDD